MPCSSLVGLLIQYMLCTPGFSTSPKTILNELQSMAPVLSLSFPCPGLLAPVLMPCSCPSCFVVFAVSFPGCAQKIQPANLCCLPDTYSVLFFGFHSFRSPVQKVPGGRWHIITMPRYVRSPEVQVRACVLLFPTLSTFFLFLPNRKALY